MAEAEAEAAAAREEAAAVVAAAREDEAAAEAALDELTRALAEAQEQRAATAEQVGPAAFSACAFVLGPRSVCVLICFSTSFFIPSICRKTFLLHPLLHRSTPFASQWHQQLRLRPGS